MRDASKKAVAEMSNAMTDYVKSPCAPLLTIEVANIAVWRVRKQGSFLLFWYALAPGCKEEGERGKPFIDVRELPAYDTAEDGPGCCVASLKDMNRAANKRRRYHAQCFAAAVADGIDLAAFAKAQADRRKAEFLEQERRRAGRDASGEVDDIPF